MHVHQCRSEPGKMHAPLIVSVLHSLPSRKQTRSGRSFPIHPSTHSLTHPSRQAGRRAACIAPTHFMIMEWRQQTASQLASESGKSWTHVWHAACTNTGHSVRQSVRARTTHSPRCIFKWNHTMIMHTHGHAHIERVRVEGTRVSEQTASKGAGKGEGGRRRRPHYDLRTLLARKLRPSTTCLCPSLYGPSSPPSPTACRMYCLHSPNRPHDAARMHIACVSSLSEKTVQPNGSALLLPVLSALVATGLCLSPSLHTTPHTHSMTHHIIIYPALARSAS
mmetsp:Transcript_19643/g.47614  ORF Transcript_19643/g.47614 Transcript_19643/m.47614 type:complete len:279 (-) Transcript_19643:560-1396(-)